MSYSHSECFFCGAVINRHRFYPSVCLCVFISEDASNFKTKRHRKKMNCSELANFSRSVCQFSAST